MSSLRNAPTMAVAPLIATELPKTSSAAPSSARSLACWVHTPPLRVKTYAEPDSMPLSSSRHAPMTAVSPLMETERPKLSSAAPSSARSLAS